MKKNTVWFSGRDYCLISVLYSLERPITDVFNIFATNKFLMKITVYFDAIHIWASN